MNGALFAAATLAFVAGAVLYFRVWFRAAGAAAVVFYASTGWLAPELLGPLGGAVALALLALPWATLLLLHAIDARVGFFNLPSFYAIPLAFLTGALLWALLAAAGLAALRGGV